MIIDDKRFVKKELSWDELEAGKVYISHKFQKYVMGAKDSDGYLLIVCLETGAVNVGDDYQVDSFEPVKATLVVE